MKEERLIWVLEQILDHLVHGDSQCDFDNAVRRLKALIKDRKKAKKK